MLFSHWSGHVDTCLRCALQLGLQTLQDYRGDTRAGNIILITGDQPPSVQLGDIIDQERVRLWVIALTDNPIPEQLHNLATAAWGLGSWLTGNTLMSQLSDVLVSINNMVEESNIVKSIQIYTCMLDVLIVQMKIQV